MSRHLGSVPAPATAEFVTSRDGTRIGYLREGSGPGIVLVQGAMADVQAYRRLAAALSGSRTVIRAERRGRGLSPRGYDDSHSLARDVEDIEAVLEATGARAIFGLSSGAVVALEATRTLESIERTIVYEPPFYEDGVDRPGMERLFAEIEDGDLPTALVDALLTAGTAPAVLRIAPRWAARAVAAAVLAVDGRTHGAASTLRSLVPGVRFDFHDVAEVDGRIEAFAAIRTPVRLLSGTRSPTFLRDAIRLLDRTLPRSEHLEFEGLGHDGPWNSGGPDAVAAAVARFLDQEQPAA